MSGPNEPATTPRPDDVDLHRQRARDAMRGLSDRHRAMLSVYLLDELDRIAKSYPEERAGRAAAKVRDAGYGHAARGTFPTWTWRAAP